MAVLMLAKKDNGIENGGDGDCDDACRYQPYLLKDINTTNTSDSDGYMLGRLNDTLFIIAVNSTFQVYFNDIISSNYQI